MNNLIQTKQLYNQLKEIICNPQLQASLVQKFPVFTNLDAEQMFFVENLMYLTYISNADGTITHREMSVINAITGKLTPLSTVRDLIDNDNFLAGIGNEIPLSVQILCAIDNILYETKSIAHGTSLMNAVVVFYQQMAQLAGGADGLSAQEQQKATTFVNMLKNYIAQNTISPFFNK